LVRIGILDFVNLPSTHSLIFATGFFAAVVVARAEAPLPAPAVASGQAWWKHAVIYEIYPRSFQDSNGDGIGDLNGIARRLDYLQALGVDAIWIAPIYPSPQVDFGYDISDYEKIDPQYGTLADFDRLLVEAKQRDIRIVLDMVLNHTSNQHPWFAESASARTNPKHDWYVWSDGRKAANGTVLPPNNWVSLFGGSAWEWVPAVRQFYYHKFYKQQPDLNWRNPAVENAMFDVMRFWLDRGVAGFRLDALPELFEDLQLRDEPALGGRNAQGDPNLNHLFTRELPEVHGTLRRMRAMISKYPGNRVLIGETYLPNVADLDRWYGGAQHDELQLPMDMNVGFINRLDPSAFRQRIEEVETQVHGSQPLFVFDNHDNVRSWDRYGDGAHNQAIAKIIATLLLTSKATALLYQGEELGQPTTPPTRVEEVRDPMGITGWPKEKGRDGERAPLPWDASDAQAGFSTNPRPWLPLPPNYRTINVQSELADPYSLLNWHRRLIALRRAIPALREGGVVMLDRRNKNVLSYARVDAQGKAVVVSLNMSGEPQTISLALEGSGINGSQVTTLLANPGSIFDHGAAQGVTLPPYAAWVASVE
jgi:alpha-glucosidase